MIINRIFALLCAYGAMLFYAGLIGGQAGLLSGDAPLWLAGTGVTLFYAAMVLLLFTRHFYRMDE